MNDELLDRIIRIETKLSRLMEAMDVDFRKQEPSWVGNAVYLPAMDITVGQIVKFMHEAEKYNAVIVYQGRPIGHISIK